MKINYKNTALHFLDDPMNIEFDLPPSSHSKEYELEFGRSVQKYFPLLAEDFKKNIQYISRPFFDSFYKGKKKLAAIFDKEKLCTVGTFIWNSGSVTSTMFYYVRTIGEGEDWDFNMCIILFTKHTSNEHQHLDLLIANDEENSKTWIWDGFVKEGRDKYWWMSFLIGFLLFQKYVDIETKIIPGGKKGYHVGNKYVNETKHKIEILDSTWFTTIIHSKGFTVGAETGGFFRWQPCGPGMVKRKLLWIMPYEKEGYTRIAKVENFRDQSLL